MYNHPLRSPDGTTAHGEPEIWSRGRLGEWGAALRPLHVPVHAATSQADPGAERAGTGWAVLDTMLQPGGRTTIPCTTGTLFSRRSGTLKIRTAAVGSDIGDEEEAHPSVYQIITIDGQAKDIIMTNDSPYPVLVAAGALVAHACLIEDGQARLSRSRSLTPRRRRPTHLESGRSHPRRYSLRSPTRLRVGWVTIPQRLRALRRRTS